MSQSQPHHRARSQQQQQHQGGGAAAAIVSSARPEEGVLSGVTQQQQRQLSSFTVGSPDGTASSMGTYQNTTPISTTENNSSSALLATPTTGRASSSFHTALLHSGDRKPSDLHPNDRILVGCNPCACKADIRRSLKQERDPTAANYGGTTAGAQAQAGYSVPGGAVSTPQNVMASMTTVTDSELLSSAETTGGGVAEVAQHGCGYDLAAAFLQQHDAAVAEAKGRRRSDLAAKKKQRQRQEEEGEDGPARGGDVGVDNNKKSRRRGDRKREGGGGGGCTASSPLGSNFPRLWSCLLVTIPVFLGLGALMKLQGHLREHLYIAASSAGGAETNNNSAANGTTPCINPTASMPASRNPLYGLEAGLLSSTYPDFPLLGGGSFFFLDANDTTLLHEKNNHTNLTDITLGGNGLLGRSYHRPSSSDRGNPNPMPNGGGDDDGDDGDDPCNNNGGDSGGGSYIMRDGDAYLKPSSRAAYLFGVGVSFYYAGLFSLRIGHNVIFGVYKRCRNHRGQSVRRGGGGGGGKQQKNGGDVLDPLHPLEEQQEQEEAIAGYERVVVAPVPGGVSGGGGAIAAKGPNDNGQAAKREVSSRSINAAAPRGVRQAQDAGRDEAINGSRHPSSPTSQRTNDLPASSRSNNKNNHVNNHKENINAFAGGGESGSGEGPSRCVQLMLAGGCHRDARRRDTVFSDDSSTSSASSSFSSSPSPAKGKGRDKSRTSRSSSSGCSSTTADAGHPKDGDAGAPPAIAAEGAEDEQQQEVRGEANANPQQGPATSVVPIISGAGVPNPRTARWAAEQRHRLACPAKRPQPQTSLRSVSKGDNASSDDVIVCATWGNASNYLRSGPLTTIPSGQERRQLSVAPPDRTPLWEYLLRPLALLPRGRAVLGLCLMAAAMLMIVALFFVLFPWIGVTTSAAAVEANMPFLVFPLALCYFLGGAAVAVFEPNIMSILTPLGKHNKSLAVVGIPFGTNIVTFAVLGSLGFASDGSPSHRTGFLVELGGYLFVAVACAAGVPLLRHFIPNVPFASSSDGAVSFVHKAAAWRVWVPKMRWPLAVAFLDQLSLAISVAIAQYIYGAAAGVPIVYPFVRDENFAVISHNQFLLAYFASAWVGAVLARHMAFFTRRCVNPAAYLVLMVLPGAALVLSKVPILAIIGIGLLMFGNGGVYGASVRTIDEHVPLEYNLVALSVWYAVGDLGGFVGANLVVPIHSSLGTV